MHHHLVRKHEGGEEEEDDSDAEPPAAWHCANCTAGNREEAQQCSVMVAAGLVVAGGAG